MFTLVWRLSGLTGSEPGHLESRNGRLIYAPIDESSPGFDVPLTDVREISFPWLYFGGGFKMSIGSDRYRFSFVEPHNHDADISAGPRTGKAWKKLLLGK